MSSILSLSTLKLVTKLLAYRDKQSNELALLSIIYYLFNLDFIESTSELVTESDVLRHFVKF